MGTFFKQSPLDDLPRALKDATQQLMLQKIETERMGLIEAAEQKWRMDARERASDTLAREWKGRIEGGRNVVRRKSLEEYQALYGEDKEYPSGGAYTGAWQPNVVPYEGEIPAEARYAYDKYMGISPEFGQKERLFKAAEAEKREIKLANIAAKKEENLLRREELAQRQLETKLIAEQKAKDKIMNDIGKMHKMAYDAYQDDFDIAKGDMLNYEQLMNTAQKKYNTALENLWKLADVHEVDGSLVLPEIETQIAETPAVQTPITQDTFNFRDIKEFQKRVFEKTNRNISKTEVIRFFKDSGLKEEGRK